MKISWIGLEGKVLNLLKENLHIQVSSVKILRFVEYCDFLKTKKKKKSLCYRTNFIN